MIATLVNRLFSLALPESSITGPEIRAFIRDGRKPFSRYLPYLAYDPETKTYFNADDSCSFMMLCTPLWNEGGRKEITSLISDLPEGAVLSAHLISSDLMEDVFTQYLKSKEARKDPLLMEIASNYISFLKSATSKGIPQMLGVPLRRFLLIVCIKLRNVHITDAGGAEFEKVIHHRAAVFEQLKSAGLNPTYLEPDFLIGLLFRLFNGKPASVHWDRLRPISSQIILSDSSIEFAWKRVRVGERLWACLTPKSLPPEIDTQSIGELIGPSSGADADGRQILSHFIFTTIVCRDESLHRNLVKKAGLFFNQLKGDASKSIIGRLIGEYAEEHSEAVNELEQGERFYYIYPLMWIFDRDEKRLSHSVQRARNLFETSGFTTQEERGILPVLFLMGLPGGFSLRGREIESLDRHFVGKKELAASLIPLVGDISGTDRASMIYISRKGQIVPFDPWAEAVQNKNCLVCGATGGGKSVNMNLLLLSLYASGALVRVVDLGYSYEKLCQTLGGQFIDFNSKTPVCLNPFSYVAGENQDDINAALESIVELILTMIFINDQKSLTKDHASLVREAVNWVWKQQGPNSSIGMVYEWLAKFPYYAEVSDICNVPENITPEEKEKLATENACLVDLKTEAQKMAYALRNWTESGPYGRWFNGRANIDLVSHDFIVLELEKLKRVPVLLAAVSQAVINAATASMYLSDKKKRKLFLFEECGVILKSRPAFKETVEEMYRRARKYNGAVVTVFQSAMDFEQIGELGHVIVGNSSYHLYMPDSQLRQAREKGVMSVPEGVIQMAESVRLVKPRYGEMVLRAPWGYGTVRCLVNGEQYYLVTTDPDDWAEVETLKSKYIDRGDDEKTALLRAIRELGEKRDRYFQEMA